MIKNGDWDMLQPQFDFYLRILKNAELRSKVYWNHGGACFTEQMENYGLPNYAEYGQNALLISTKELNIMHGWNMNGIPFLSFV